MGTENSVECRLQVRIEKDLIRLKYQPVSYRLLFYY